MIFLIYLSLSLLGNSLPFAKMTQSVIAKWRCRPLSIENKKQIYIHLLLKIEIHKKESLGFLV